MSSPTIAIEPRSLEVASAINDKLGNFNRDSTGRPEPQHIHVILRDTTGAMRGAVIGLVSFDVLFIDSVWIDEPLRGGDHGSRMIAMIEQEGRKRGAALVWLDTYSWQARPFYEKLGYRVFGELPYAGGKHQRFFMRKDL
jgi:GNAT superfamily N-acetyltransferase